MLAVSYLEHYVNGHSRSNSLTTLPDNSEGQSCRGPVRIFFPGVLRSA
jgi:hypothetical protein